MSENICSVDGLSGYRILNVLKFLDDMPLYGFFSPIVSTTWKLSILKPTSWDIKQNTLMIFFPLFSLSIFLELLLLCWNFWIGTLIF